MNKYKAKIVIALVMLVALAGAWFMGNVHVVDVAGSLAAPYVATNQAESEHQLLSSDYLCPPQGEGYSEEGEGTLNYEPSTTIVIYTPPVKQDEAIVIEPETSNPVIEQEKTTKPETSSPAAEQQETTKPEPDSPNIAEVNIQSGAFTVWLTVRVDTLVANKHLLNREMHELVPSDGIIFPLTPVTVYEGENVFQVLQREMRAAGIHMSSRFTPAFGSAYVEAINNLFEFDAGPLSGWMYRVNGDFPNFGSSLYILSPGDVIEWLYTVDLGRDIGVHSLADG